MLGEFNKWAEFKKLETGINLLFPWHSKCRFEFILSDHEKRLHVGHSLVERFDD